MQVWPLGLSADYFYAPLFLGSGVQHWQVFALSYRCVQSVKLRCLCCVEGKQVELIESNCFQVYIGRNVDTAKWNFWGYLFQVQKFVQQNLVHVKFQEFYFALGFVDGTHKIFVTSHFPNSEFRDTIVLTVLEMTWYLQVHANPQPPPYPSVCWNSGNKYNFAACCLPAQVWDLFRQM